MNPERQYHRWDSNPYWTDFKSVVSANWTTVAQEEQGVSLNPVKRCCNEPCLPLSIIVSISTLSRAIFSKSGHFRWLLHKKRCVEFGKDKTVKFGWLLHQLRWGQLGLDTCTLDACTLDACTPERMYIYWGDAATYCTI